MRAPLINVSTFALGVAVLAASAGTLTKHRSGKPLSASSGYRLNMYDPDGSGGTSACLKACAAVWPPYIADHGAKPSADFSLSTRIDGTRQCAYKHRPRYLVEGDASPGDPDGDDVDGIRHLIP